MAKVYGEKLDKTDLARNIRHSANDQEYRESVNDALYSLLGYDPEKDDTVTEQLKLSPESKDKQA